MDELAKQFSDVAAKYAPNVVDASLAAAQIAAVSAMMGGLVALGIAYALYRVGRWLWRKAEADSCDGDLLGFAGRE